MKTITRFLVLSLFVLCFAFAASAATFTVTTTGDTADTTPGDGTCSDGSGCSLRAAISEANALAGDDIITLPAGTYTQTLTAATENLNAGGDWDITSNITINGAGAGTTILQANASPNTATERVMDIRVGATATINGVTFRHGAFNGTMTADTRGAGVENLGTLTLNGCIVTLNQITSNNGNPLAAGINNGAATLTLLNTVVTANTNTRTTGGSAFGGGLGSTGTATITIVNSSISGNTATSLAGGFGFAAGVYLQDTFQVNASFSHFDANTGVGTSGSNGVGVRALSNLGAANFTATNCTFDNNVGNTGTSNQGVGLQLFTSTAVGATLNATVVNSSISGNSALNSVGAGLNATATGGLLTANFRGTTLAGNSATGTNSFGGGAFFSNAGSLVTSPLTVTFTNSTISGNNAATGGGGLAAENPTTGVVTVNLNFATVANNTGGATNGGGGLLQAGAVINLKNSIIADNTSAGVGPDLNGTFVSQNFNHIENTTGATITGSTANNTTGDPNLGALAANGGPTLTQQPNTPSLVLDTIPSGTNECGTTIAVDQRGFPRPSGGSCDKGSVERVLGALQHYIDYDGDGRTDFSVIRNTGGGPGGQLTWFNLNTTTGAQFVAWGLSGDSWLPGDYDGDNKSDIAVFRPAQGAWYIFQSATGTLRAENFGQSGDNPTVVGDYDGDGKDDLAVYRAGASAGAQSFWFYRTTVAGPTTSIPWGQNGDFVAPGDYDGDGKSDFVIQRNAGGGQARFWRLFATGTFDSLIFGTPTDVVVPGDYDGDGKTDIATARSSGGQILWWIHPSTGGADVAQLWGNAAGDFIAQGDYDGDGKTDRAIWRPNADPTQNYFFVLSSTSGFFTQEWGQNGDSPVGNYNVH